MSLIISGTRTKKCISWIGEHINSPEQRLLLGATALATQPIIDYKNKDVDEDTRMISVARTLGKIIAGTLVGVLVRHASIESIRHLSQYIPHYDKSGALIGIMKKRKCDIFTPLLSNIKPTSLAQFEKDYLAYIKTAGTYLAAAAMVVTNFAVDAPLTRFLTRKFHTHLTKNPNIAKKEDK